MRHPELSGITEERTNVPVAFQRSTDRPSECGIADPMDICEQLGNETVRTEERMNMPFAFECSTDRQTECSVADPMDVSEPSRDDAADVDIETDNILFQASSSSQIIDNHVHPTVLRARGLAVLEDNFYRSKQTGIRISLFHNDSERVSHLASLHGIQTVDRAIEDITANLVHHTIFGHCHRSKTLPIEQQERISACKFISAGFSSGRDLSDAIIDSFLLYQDDMSKLPPKKLLMIVDAMDYPRPSTFQRKDINCNARRDAIQRLKAFRKTTRINEKAVRDMFSSDFEDMSRTSIASVAISHGIQIDRQHKKDEIKDLIIDHLVNGRCMSNVMIDDEELNSDASLCARSVSEFLCQPDISVAPENFNVFAVSAGLEKMTLKAARRVARMLNIPCDSDDRKAKIKTSIRKWIKSSMKGKKSVSQNDSPDQLEDMLATRTQWPQVVSNDLKERIKGIFKEITSHGHLASVTCASCGTMTPKAKSKRVSIKELDLDCLKRPDLFEPSESDRETQWLDPDVEAPPMPYDNGPLKDVLVAPEGVSVDKQTDDVILTMCKTCFNSVKRKEVPPLAFSNKLYLGPVPPALQDLTVVEEAMIARCRASCWVVQLKEDNQNVVVPTSQRGMKGHIIIYPQNPSAIAASLPPTVEEMTSPLCVLFVGASKPSDEWLRDKAKPLAVRGNKVRNALYWLKSHNRYYKDIAINESVLAELDANPILPFHVEHVIPSGRVDEVTARYDNASQLDSDRGVQHDVAFENVVISDVQGSATSNELRAAAFRHVKTKGKGYIQVGRESQAINEFNNPAMLPMCYPTLFPYGIGGSDDPNRPNPISLKRQSRHFFSTRDQRFQLHYSFMFIVFNIMQRRESLLRTSLKTKKENFPRVAAQFAEVSAETIHVVTERVSRGDLKTAHSREELKVLELMRQVNAVSSHVPGSPASKVTMRNQIKSLIVDQGLPHFYITINPADVFNPLVKFLAGSDIDIDKCLPSDHEYYQQALLVAKNPAAAARFFNVYMKAFIFAVLGYDEKNRNSDGGILGKVKAYYGTVEAQGRGTLHCHMMVWVEGGLHPDEIKRKIVEDKDDNFQHRLVAFLDDTISTELPPDPDPSMPAYNPCAVRHPPPCADQVLAEQKDKHLLALRCQYHTHSKTCFKYDPRKCRFELGDDKKLRPITTVNADTGEIELRCLHSLVNNFNHTMLSTMRCNMDIKYIGSGASAKAVVFYITDYITKSQLQAHVAYAALELAYKKLGEVNVSDDDVTLRAKRLLQRCVYTMISHQEMSAQQVASYLLDYEDHFTSHKFVNIFWTSFERYVNENDPSPECYSMLSPLVATPDDPMQDSCETTTQNLDHDAEIEHEVTHSLMKDTCFDEEITIRTDHDGAIIPRTSAVEDYVHRGESLHDVSVWDYFSRVEKVSKKNDARKHRKKTEHAREDLDGSASDTADGEDDSENESKHEEIPNDAQHILWDIHFHPNPLLACQKKKRPRIDFSATHTDVATHRQKTRARKYRLVPVPIGPALPRRDRDTTKEKHARLMLILLKPWQNPFDLRTPGVSWSEEYQSFYHKCSERVRRIIDNMQVLHECRDARDDHFASRSKRARQGRMTGEGEEAEQNHIGESFSEEFIHEHLKDIENFQSENIDRISDTASQCFGHVEQSGFFDSSIAPLENQSNDLSPEQSVRVNGPKDNDLELQWLSAYDARKKKSKIMFTQATSDYHPVGHATESGIVTCNDFVGNSHTAGDTTDLPFSSDLHCAAVDCVVSGNASLNLEHDVDLEALTKNWNLNEEQCLAFRLVVQKSMSPMTDPLRLIISGPGGTGKSRVLQAISDFFHRKNQSRRLRLASYTGIAAKNIHGSTLHSVLNLSAFSKRRGNPGPQSDLVSMWQGVDFLFIDEFSMIGCGLLYEISHALSVAKENIAPFGGINMIFAGDFAQLPPVGYKRLYSQTFSSNKSKDNRVRSTSEKDVIGKLLWLSVRKVVILKEVWRQKADPTQISSTGIQKTTEFVDLLSRLREGRCTDEDYRLLSSRVITNVVPNWNSPEWVDTPMIVCQNETKDVLNNAAAIAFAKRTGHELHWYYAIDRHDGHELVDDALVNHLRKLNSSVTAYRLGKLPLVNGMPVMVASNFDVEGGVVNGCAAILDSVRYWVDERGDRHANSCVIRADSISGEAMPNLRPHQAVAIADEKAIKFVHPASKKKCSIKRTQIPIMPAFAMTAHKAQGLTMPKVMIDLESCRGSEAPYVMVSRVKSLDGLLIMRPFDQKRICCRMSEDVRREFSRLRLLELLTIVENGEGDEVTVARKELEYKGLADLIGQEYTDVNLETMNADLLRLRQASDDMLLTLLESTASSKQRKKRMRAENSAVPQAPTKRLRLSKATALT